MTYYQKHKEKILQKSHDRYLLKKHGLATLGLRISKLEAIVRELVRSLNIIDKLIK